MNETIIKLLILISIVCLLGVVGEMDRQDAELAQRQYCQNVSARLWAKFKTNINCDEIVGKDYGL